MKLGQLGLTYNFDENETINKSKHLKLHFSSNISIIPLKCDESLPQLRRNIIEILNNKKTLFGNNLFY